MTNISIHLSEDFIAKNKEQALKNSKDLDPSLKELWFDDLNLNVDSFEFDKDKGNLVIFGDFNGLGDSDGFVSLIVPIDLDLVSEIVQHYMKKLGRLKTILEATK